MLLKYSDFLKGEKLNENLDQAKKLLKDTYKFNKALTSVSRNYETDNSGLFILDKSNDRVKISDIPEDAKNNAKAKFREIKLDQIETQELEKGKVISAVRNIVGDKLGYAYMFTYLLIVEGVAIDDLKELLNKLNLYKDILNLRSLIDGQPLFRRPISNYIDPNDKNNFESLSDDFDRAKSYKAVKNMLAELTPVLKRDFEESPLVIKQQVEELAVAFGDLGMKDGVVDPKENEKLWKLFFGRQIELEEDTEIRGVLHKKGELVYTGQMFRYKNIREFIKAANNHLKSADNEAAIKFYETIDKCNQKYGNFGCKVCFDENGILILEIKSFQANVLMNAHTSHCIKDSLGHWNGYVGGDDKFAKQYYIYNFNLSSADSKSVIGITIGPKQNINACHLKLDQPFSSNFKSLLIEWEKKFGVEDLWSYFKPMTDKEIEEKKRRLVSNKEIVKKGLSIEKLNKLLTEDGADVNAGTGLPLDNAVVEGDVEKVQFLLDFGADPNLRKTDSTINKISGYAKDPNPETSKKAFEILQMMVAAGAELTSVALRAVLADYEAVKFCLDNGLDPNFDDGLAVRLSIKNGQLKILKLLEEKGARLVDKPLLLAWAYDSGNTDIVRYLVEKGLVKDFGRSMYFIGISFKMSIEKIIESLKDMQTMIDQGKVEPSGTYRIVKDGKTVDASYEETIGIYGNLYNWVVKMNLDKFNKSLKQSGMNDGEIKKFLAYP